MNILDSVLYKEILKKEATLRSLKAELSNLPKGTLFIRKTDKEMYAYRKWREGNKVYSEYLGKFDSDKTIESIKLMNKYKMLNERVKKETNELSDLKKAYKLVLTKTNLN